MHLYRKRRIPYIGVCVTFFVFFGMLGYSLYGFANISESLKDQQHRALQEAIDSAVISCYAIEGHYPPSIEYIQEHYGVIIDQEKYEVFYLASKGNRRPEVQVLLRGGAQE